MIPRGMVLLKNYHSSILKLLRLILHFMLKLSQRNLQEIQIGPNTILRDMDLLRKNHSSILKLRRLILLFTPKSNQKLLNQRFALMKQLAKLVLLKSLSALILLILRKFIPLIQKFANQELHSIISISHLIQFIAQHQLHTAHLQAGVEDNGSLLQRTSQLSQESVITTLKELGLFQRISEVETNKHQL